MELELGAGEEPPDAESFLFFDLLLESLARESTRCLKPFILLHSKIVCTPSSGSFSETSAPLDTVQMFPRRKPSR